MAGALEIDTLAMAGYMAQHFNDPTIRQAMREGVDVELLADASDPLPYSNSATDPAARKIHVVMPLMMASSYVR